MRPNLENLSADSSACLEGDIKQRFYIVATLMRTGS